MSPRVKCGQHWHEAVKALRVALVCCGGLWLQGCSNNPDGFELSGFSTEQESTIRSAAAEWCRDSGGAHCPTVGGGDSELVGVDTLAPDLGEGDVSTIGLAIHRADGTDIYLVRSLPLETLRVAALHEFGHHFGCRDTDDGTVMDANFDHVSDSHLTAAVLACATR